MNMKYSNADHIFAKTGDRIPGRTECSKDFILPDSYPDIKKILYACADLIPERCEINAGKLTNQGTLVCKVAFTADSGEMRSAEFRTDYKVSAAVQGGDDLSVICMPSVESVSARAVNPRKVGIRAAIALNADTWKDVDLSPELPDIFSAEDLTSIESKEETVEFMTAASFSESGHEVSEDIELDRSQAEIDEIVFADAEINITNVIHENGALTIKGSAVIDIIYRAAGGNTVQKVTELPFSQVMDADNAPLDAEYVARAYVDKLSAIPADNAFGESKVIEVDLSYSAFVTALSKDSAKAACDAFSTLCCTGNQISELKYSCLLPAFRFEERRSAECECDPGSQIISVFPDVSFTTGENGRTVLLISISTVTESSENGLVCRKVDDIAELDMPDSCLFIGDAFVRSLSCRVDGDRLKFNYDVYANALCFANAECSYVSGMTLETSEDDDISSALTVCYLSQGETLWDAAKRYRVGRGALMAANNMSSPDEIRRVILIPKRRKADFSKII